MGGQCSAALIPLKFPDLKAKNIYNYSVSPKQLNQQKLNQLALSLFDNNHQLIKTQHQLLSYLSSLEKNDKFIDPNFPIQGQRLSSLYDYHRKNMKLYSGQNKPSLSLMQQQQVQFSYISSVLFFFCQNKSILRNKVFLINQINQERHLYGFRLFCNGEEHSVLVDDIVPVTSKNDLKYCLLKEKQIWPVLLEKAWCKMIGGYDKARGLSPQECFLELTGFPASSTKIQNLSEINIYGELQKLQYEGNWLCVVAYHETDILRPGQVFVIDKIDDQIIYLTSPYTKFKVSDKEQIRQGTIKIKFHRFRSLFEYLIIGYFNQGYSPICKKFIAQKREEKVYELRVKEKQDISIRFTQFFRGYLDDTEKTNYEYSPIVTFELYDSKGILHFCQGCDRLYSGAHSVYFTKNIFHSLNKDRYYLRIQVDWEHPTKINQGNIVIYASQNNVEIEEVEEKTKIFQLHQKTLENPKSVVIRDEVEETNHEYELRFIEKRTNVLISVSSKVEKLLSLELNFENSHNFRVKYSKLHKNKTVILNLASLETKYLQILPEEPKMEFKIQPFTVKKLSGS